MFRWATLNLKLPYNFILPWHNVGGNGEIELLVLEDPKSKLLGADIPKTRGKHSWNPWAKELTHEKLQTRIYFMWQTCRKS